MSSKIILLSALLLSSKISYSQTGALDPTFNGNGKVTTSFGPNSAEGLDMAVQSDGKIVMVGRADIGSNFDFALARYNTNGTLDATFGSNGKVTTAVGASHDYAFSVAVQIDGKIVVAGANSNDLNDHFAIVRYNSDGTLDSDFGTGGKVLTDFGTGDDYINSVALQSDGKIVVAGYTYITNQANFALARYNTNGTLDISFGDDGKVITSVGSFGQSGIRSVVLGNDGKIIAAGYSYNGSNVDFALARYNTNGTLDASFGSGGKVTTAVGASHDYIRSLVLQNDGKIVVAGFSNNGTNDDFAIARYNTNGTLDVTFDGDGKVTTAFGASDDQASSVSLQNDGKIIAAGYSYNGLNSAFALSRYNTNGTLDAGFDGDGKQLTDFTTSNDFGSAVKLSRSRIYVAGTSTEVGTLKNHFAVAAYMNDVLPPAITSFTPSSGPIGTSVTIKGTGFNTISANNIVYFGAVRATVISASSTSLTVTVPVGATYQPISVLDNTTGLTAYSSKPFIATFTNPFGTGIPANFYKPKVDFVTSGFPRFVVTGDVDGDGKPDLVLANQSSNSISVLRNTSTSGSIIASSFAAKVDFMTGNDPISVAMGDVDGDGKPDLVVANNSSNTISVLRNISNSSIDASSFAAKVDFDTGISPFSVAINDIDGDGKPDLVVTNFNANTISVLRNTSTSRSISASSFAPKVDFATGLAPVYVAIGDVDGDGKPDLVVANQSTNSISVLRNTSTSGSISASSFAIKVDFLTGIIPLSVAIGDVNGDDKPDLVVANRNSATLSVLRNTSNQANIDASSFATKVDFTTGTGPSSVAIGDLDGDGNPDLVVAANRNSAILSVLRNTSNQANIVASSFAAKVDFTTGTSPFSVAIGDVDGDGIPEIAVANASSNTVSVFQIANPSSTSVTSSANPSIAGQNITFTATVAVASGTPTGTVGFFDGTVNLGSGTLTGPTATFITSSLNAGSHSITATYAGDTNYLTSTSSVIIQDVTAANTAPVLTSIGNKSVNELQELSFTALATDGDLPSNTLTFSLDNPISGNFSTGASITSSGIFSWIPTETQGPGIYRVKVVVSNGTDTDEEEIEINVAEVNAPPVLTAIGDKNVNELQELNFTALATDSDLPANTLAFSLDNPATGNFPTGAVITSTGLFTWTPSETQGPGIYRVKVVVSDGTDTDEEEIQISVSEVNTAPVLTSIGNKSLNELQELSFTALATDGDLPANTLTFSLDNPATGNFPTGSSISAGIFSWTPTEIQGPGIYRVKVVVSDGTDTDEEEIQISVSEDNTAPVLTSIGNKSVNELQELSFTSLATDSDLPANTLTFSLDNPATGNFPAGASITLTGIFSWTPTETQGPGIFRVKVVVSDGTDTDEEEIEIAVTEGNSAPVLTFIKNKSVNELQELSFTALATDGDLPANILSFSLDNPATGNFPTGAGITSAGVFTWTPTETQGPGIYRVKVVVSDGTDTDEEEIEINVAEVNAAPVLTAIGDKNGNELQELNFTALAADGDLPVNTLTFSLNNPVTGNFPTGASISSAGVFTWTPSETQGPGIYGVKVVVSDGTDTDEEEIQINVVEVNVPPVLTAIGDKSANELQQLSFTALANDSDLPAITLAFSLSNPATGNFPTGASITSAGIFSWIPTETQGPGIYRVKVVVFDGTDRDEEEIEIVVTEVNAAPVLTFIGNKNVNELQELSFTALAADGDLPSNTLSFSLDNPATGIFPTGASITSAGIFSWTPSETQGPGIYRVKVVVSDGTDTDEEEFEITVNEVNSAPSFTKGLDQTVFEDSAPQSINAWASAISEGSAGESGQTLTFIISNNKNGLFSVQPAVSAGGTLTYTAAGNANGSATVNISLKDDGGKANGGSDQSAAQTFTITVSGVNDVPSFIKGANQTVNINAGSQSVLAWASSISAGPVDESVQGLNFTVSNTNNSLFSIQPAISPNGTLSYVGATNASGSANVTVVLNDNGGTENGGVNQSAAQTFTITINPSLVQQVISFTLINASNEQDIQTFTNGAILNLATLPSKNLNIRANTSPATVGRVVFALTGTQTRNQTETGAPYALFGDVNGNYNIWTTPVGNYTLKATPFTASSGGTAGTALTITFNVINQGGVNQLPTANAGPDKSITLPVSSVVLSGTGSDPENGSNVTFAWIQVSGPNTAIFSNATVATPTVSGLAAGSYVFRLIVKDQQLASSPPDQVTVTVNPAPIGQQVISFTLINADNEQVIQTLSNGSTLNLTTLPTRNLNIRANTSPALVGRVVFALTGTQTRNQTETTAPYALFGDVNGNYNIWIPPAGNYTLKGTPFTTSSGGTAGTALTISFNVINAPAAIVQTQVVNSPGPQVIPPLIDKGLQVVSPAFEKVRLSAYPNPFGKNATVLFTLPADEQRVILDVYDLKGSRIKRLYEGKADANQTLQFEFDGSYLSPGVYLLRLSTSKNLENLKIIMTE